MNKNRQIKTGFDQSKEGFTLEVLSPVTIGGKTYEVGEAIPCSRSEAKRFMSLDKKAFRIVV